MISDTEFAVETFAPLFSVKLRTDLEKAELIIQLSEGGGEGAQLVASKFHVAGVMTKYEEL